MRVICTSTNATIDGAAVPMGFGEWPWHGSLVVTNGGVATNITTGVADTVIVQPGQVTVAPGYDPTWAMILAFGAVFSGVALLGFARKSGRVLLDGVNRGDM